MVDLLIKLNGVSTASTLPFINTIALLASLNISLKSWLTTTAVVLVSLIILLMSSINSSFVGTSKAENGSSKKITSGSIANALAKLTLCDSPPESKRAF